MSNLQRIGLTCTLFAIWLAVMAPRSRHSDFDYNLSVLIFFYGACTLFWPERKGRER